MCLRREDRRSADPSEVGQNQLYFLEIASETSETKSGTVAFKDVEKLTQATAAVGGLLLQFRHHQRLLLPEYPDQKRLWVKRGVIRGTSRS